MSDIRLYSNKSAQSKILDMFASGRVSHSFLITGPKGCGKKTFAKYLTALILCEHHENGSPCFKCSSCKKVIEGVHPDVLYAEHFGKRGGFKKDYLREAIVSDAYIKPNDGEYRVFVFEDCENFSADAQNVMLKIIEEPPAHAKFIFTAPSKSIFLPTILSRVFEIELFEPTLADCAVALRDKGVSEEKIPEALERFGADIGKCIAFAAGEIKDNEDKVIEHTRSIIEAILAKNEYNLGFVLSKMPSERDAVFSVIDKLKACIRDAVILSESENITLLGNMKYYSEKMKAEFSADKLYSMNSELSKAALAMDRNVNTGLLFAALGANISKLWR